MKIRNLNYYIDFICNHQSTPDALGTDNDKFLKTLYGERKSIESVITGAASFASQAKEQLFYEFVQNAYDAKADSLFFFANNQYLIVLNNGEPFYTDLEEDVNKLREGQLYSFLAKGQSQKLHNDETLGKYGQGSKLLYTLIADENDYIDIESLLKEAIINQKKGPYLISWNDMAQLDALLVNKTDWVPAATDDFKNNILFTKIIMSYYPVLPYEKSQWFTNEEAQEVIQTFDSLVQPRRNKFFLNRGTALIIPLGEGKYESIRSKENMSNVMDRLGGFASITARQSKNRHTHLDHIYVFGEEITQYQTDDIDIDFSQGGKEFHYHFAFNKEFAAQNTVNFYKGLPIIETKYKLGYIIDSDAFEVDDSRQRITDTDKTGKQIRCAYEHLVKHLEVLKEEAPDRFLEIYKCILSSKVLNIKGDEIKNAFEEVLMNFVKSNVLTTTGTFVPMEKIYQNTDALQFQLEDIGIEDRYWADPVIAEEINRHLSNGKLATYPLGTLLKNSDPIKLTKWIKNATTEEYVEFISKAITVIEQIPETKLFLSNKRNIYSWNSIHSDLPVFFSFKENQFSFTGCEYIEYQFPGDVDGEYFEVILNKIKQNIESLRSSSQQKETICQFCAKAYDEDDSQLYQIIYNIPILKNALNEYCTFDRLFLERPKDTIIFDKFIATGYIPECVKRSDWFIDSSNKDRMRKWLSENFEQIKKIAHWGKYTAKYLQDIKSVCPDNCEAFLTLYLDNDGVPTDTECFSLENMIRLSESDYEQVVEVFPEYNFVPYKFYKNLSTSPFKLRSLSADELIDYANQNNTYFDLNVLKIFNNITEDFIYSHRFIEINNLFEVSRLPYGNNYYDEVDDELRTELTHIGYYHVPEKVQSIGSRTLTLKDKKHISRIIDKIGNKMLLLPIVKDCDNDTIALFFSSLETMNITKKLSESSAEWQAIQLASQRSTSEHDLKERILELLLCNGKRLPEEIIDKTISIRKNTYNVYDLINQYRLDNEIIENFRDLLPSVADAEWFIGTFYEGKMTKIDSEDVYNDLYNYYLNIEQLRFCIDYSLANNVDYHSLEISKDMSLTDALDMVRDNDFKNFDIYFSIDDYESCNVYAPDTLLTNNEILPTELKEWISQNEKSIELFSELRTEKDPHIAMRKSILNNTRFVDVPDYDTVLSDYDMAWLAQHDQEIAFLSPSFETIKLFQETVPEGNEDQLMLRYIGKIQEANSTTNPFTPFFKTAMYTNEGFLLDPKLWDDMFCKLLGSDKKFQQFFNENIVYYFETDNDAFLKMQLETPKTLEVSIKAKEGIYKELNTPAYNHWIESSLSRGIHIQTSAAPIKVGFALEGDGKELYSKQLENQDFGYEINKTVIVRYPNNENIPVLKMIGKHISSMDFFKEPFIALQDMYLDNYSELEEIAKSKGQDVTSIVKESQNGIGSNNLYVDVEKLQAIREIAERFDPEMIIKIVEKKEIIEDIIDELRQEEDESKESKARAIIGYIGEKIYCKYLDNMHKEYDYAAEKGVGEYDIFNKTDNTYLDIKTTAYSLKDGTAPFYLHKSQNKFMQDHQDAIYHIVRISLKDLSLIKAYEDIRDTFGKNEDPSMNKRLKKECDLIASRYWRGAKIEEFDTFSPEYSIKIEKK